MSTTTSSTTSTPTGSTGAGGGNMLRITGLNTGLDIDAMVKKMLTADQTKIDKAKQQQQLIQWRQEAYQSIIKDVKDLQSSYFDVAKSANNLLSSGNYNNMTANSLDTTGAVSAKAAAGTAAGTYKIKVNDIAQAAVITSTNSVNSQYKIATDVSNWKNGTISFAVTGGTTASLDLTGFTGTGTSTTDVNNLTSYINNQINIKGLNGEVSASVVTDSTGNNYIKFTPASGTNVNMTTSGITDIGDGAKTLISTSSSTKLTDLKSNLNTSIALQLNYNGKDVTVTLDNSNGTATIDDLNTAIKNATGGAVIGKFDDMTGKFQLQTTTTGSTSSLSVESGTSSDLLTALNMSVSASPAQGSDANVTITQPGSTTGTTLTESSNNFTVNGVSYSITGTTDSDVSISVTQDTSKMHDLISNFIDKYNNVVGEIQDKLSEKKDYGYQPLTDSQKSSMSATDITNWETKAKQGILRNDDNLQNILDNLTSAFTSPVLDSSGKSVSTLYFGSHGSNAIGIDTSDDVTQGGKISITDDEKFTDAITNHADEIMKLFTTTSTSTDKATNFNQSGIFQRLSQILTDNVGMIGTSYNSSILTKYANLQDDYSSTGSSGTGTLPDQIYEQQLIITNLTTRMSDDQTKYYNQFTQLETAMEQLNAQQSTISSYFG